MIRFIILLCLAGCATKQVVVPILPPPSLVIAPSKPTLPDAQHATQKDVALYLIELNSTLDVCHAQLDALSTWRAAWLTK